MNWFRSIPRSSSVTNNKQSSMSAVMPWAGGYCGAGPGVIDPGTWFEAFQSHWLQAYQILQQYPTPCSVEHVTAVSRHLDQMTVLLLAEVNSSAEPLIGPIMDCLFTENILEKITLWMSFAENDPVLSGFCKRNMLKLYEGILNNSRHCLLVHKPILTPILQLLEDCSRLPKSEQQNKQQQDVLLYYGTSPVEQSTAAELDEQVQQQQDYEIEKLFVLLLNQIVVKITDFKEQSPLLLEFFFKPTENEEGPPKFLVFSLLIPYLYDEGNVGQLARDAVLLILAVSRRVESVGRFIAEHSTFCPVLASGLSAVFSSLPRRLNNNESSDDWHRITPQDIESNAELKSFYNALEFCNAVVQVGHKMVLEQLLDFIYQGFLVPVMGAALLENSLEELVAATSYLELFLRTVTETPLMKILLKFLIHEQYDNVNLLETLVTRISSNSRLCTVSLALFETLLNLHCEDLMFELLLKYLVPCTHLMVSQSSHVTDIESYGRSAERFLSLIPRCCATLFNSNDHLSSASSAGSLDAAEDHFPSGHRSLAAAVAMDTNNRSRSSSSASNAAANNDTVYEFDADTSVKPLEVGYLEYLMDARCRLQHSLEACKCWSLPYDGKTPDPHLLRNLDSSSSSSGSSAGGGSVPSNGNSNENHRHDATTLAPSGVDDFPHSTDDVVDDDARQQFLRQTSFRKSKTNRYYHVRHGSLLTNSSVPHLHNLALGDDEDCVVQLHDDGSNTEQAFLRRNSKDGSTPSDSGPSSTLSTPRYRTKDVMTRSMPANYFMISYDEEMMNGAATDSQEESSDAASMLVLRGWSQIQDATAFLEILNRVRVGQAIGQKSLDDTLGYIAGVYDLTHKTALFDQQQEQDELKRLEELAQSKDSGFDQSDGGIDAEKMDDGLMRLRNLPKSSFSSPDIGPFLSILLHKLENMLQNSLFTNLHLTGVIAKLACYPQPLITSFLLNNTFVFQPSIRSLHQVLSALRNKVDAYACSVDNFESLLIRGQKFLFQRDKRYLAERRRSRGACIRANTVVLVDEESAYPNGESSGSGKYNRNNNKYRATEKKTGLSHFFNLQSSSRTKDSQKKRSESLGKSPSRNSYKFQHQHRKNADSPEALLETMKTKNVVYCAIVLEEFLKELSAISQEHSIRHVDHTGFGLKS